ncbi:FAD dependent oxidoreductase [Lophiotrema nucula]|uniref:FAD dependent oxidoreductase n=1 Tax=Lophiotrema nucula TaxID=690887 RepID=A0A6A5Z2T4_9PLEO|nr:FAD dependent oxidoreductase [Lophiotrema nucula]
MAHIVVIGAGIIGLQTAITLLEAGYQVTVIAKHYPGEDSIDYTSPWAGAIWRTHSRADQVERCEWDLESYQTWMEIMQKDPEEAFELGIERRPISIYSRTEEQVDTTSPHLWFSSRVHNFAIVEQSALPPGCTSGYTYSSVAINPRTFLYYLVDRAKHLGVHFLHAELPTEAGLPTAIKAAIDLLGDKVSGDSPASMVNCTGINAGKICKDDSVYPIRGQTVTVRVNPQPPREITMMKPADPSDQGAYIVPRPGTDTFILGGTWDPHDWSSEPDPEVTEGIIERCKKVWKGLAADAELEIVSEQVGLRPGRSGGVRLEIEKVEVGDGKKVDVVHHYGHEGAGYQLSIGSAKKVLSLLQETVK